jgi:SNF2 family DNA or RNA helicase
VIIFSQFTRLLRIVQSELELNGANSCYLDGQTTKREEVIQQFKENNEKKTFLISIKAGGVGLNLTNASYCIILDPWWNPAVEAQAIDRIHRIGQKNPVFAYRLITKDTIEEKVSNLQDKKKELYKTILDSNEGFIKELSKNDINFLLS